MSVAEVHLTTMSRAIEFIETSLREEISIADVADAVHYSLFHFCRMFNAIVHHTPYDYLMRRRLSEAARELLTTDKKIIEIAFDYQFNSPETFARAFKRMFDMQPNQWRKQMVIPRRSFMPRLSLAHLQHLHKGIYLKPVIAEYEAFSVAGLMTRVTNEHTEIPALWQLLLRELNRCPQSLVSPVYFGISWLPNDAGKHPSFYMAALAVTPNRDINPALVVKTLPAGQYACFMHHGTWGERSLTFDYIYHTYLPKSGRTLAVPLEIECYGSAVPEMTTKDAEWKVLIPLQEH